MASLYLELANTYDIRADLGKLALPVLVISRQGPGRTPLIPMESCRRVAAAIPGARFVVYESSPAVCAYFEYRAYHGMVCQFLASGAQEMPLDPCLSPREVEVLRLVAQGKTNSNIAALLTISKNTADRHVSNILAKTGASNRAEAVLYATRHSLVG